MEKIQLLLGKKFRTLEAAWSERSFASAGDAHSGKGGN